VEVETLAGEKFADRSRPVMFLELQFQDREVGLRGRAKGMQRPHPWHDRGGLTRHQGIDAQQMGVSRCSHGVNGAAGRGPATGQGSQPVCGLGPMAALRPRGVRHIRRGQAGVALVWLTVWLRSQAQRGGKGVAGSRLRAGHAAARAGAAQVLRALRLRLGVGAEFRRQGGPGASRLGEAGLAGQLVAAAARQGSC